MEYICSLSCRKLFVSVDATDDNYMPKKIQVYGGERDNLKKLNDIAVDEYV